LFDWNPYISQQKDSAQSESRGGVGVGVLYVDVGVRVGKSIEDVGVGVFEPLSMHSPLLHISFLAQQFFSQIV